MCTFSKFVSVYFTLDIYRTIYWFQAFINQNILISVITKKLPSKQTPEMTHSYMHNFFPADDHTV